MDMTVFLKLQQRVRDLEKERKQFETKMEKKESDTLTHRNTMEGDLGTATAQVGLYGQL